MTLHITLIWPKEPERLRPGRVLSVGIFNKKKGTLYAKFAASLWRFAFCGYGPRTGGQAGD
jgi:hypothetical protein